MTLPSIPFSAKDTARVIGAFATALAAAIVALYACTWVGGRIVDRNAAFWPATFLVTWLLFSCAGNLAFLRKERRVMTTSERLGFAALSAALPAFIIIAGAVVMSVGFHLMYVLTDEQFRPKQHPVPGFLLQCLAALLLAVPVGGLAGRGSVAGRIQEWFLRHMPR